jgi:peptidoglycan/LPS O-acetylase OafA/YrhL
VPQPQARPIPRHYGLDWLRIGAFGLLILFHIGLYFAPGHWVVKTPRPVAWLSWPLAAIVPWRLSVLFAVSGYATAAMLLRHPGLGAFMIERSKRLLIPLAFGMLVVIPPQERVRLETGGGRYAWTTFLGHDAFSFSRHAGVFMPGWEHLWFLPYLWVYTLALVGLLAAAPRQQGQARKLGGWLTRGRRLVWAPLAIIALGMAGLARLHIPGLSDSADYLPTFLFGFAYAHSAALRAEVRRQCRAAALCSIAALAALWTLLGLGGLIPDRLGAALGLMAGAAMSWTMVIVCFNLAERLLNRDHRWRRPLAAAVFPAYIVHQTAIVLTGWELGRRGVVGLSAFAVLLTVVMATCALTWGIARVVPGAGVLLGLPQKAGRRGPQLSAFRPA